MSKIDSEFDVGMRPCETEMQYHTWKCAMDLKMFLAVFGTVLLAELGDKTQLATALYASKPSVSLATVFVASSAALVLSSAIAVAGGALISSVIDPRYLTIAAGIGFVAVGLWTLFSAL